MKQKLIRILLITLTVLTGLLMITACDKDTPAGDTAVYYTVTFDPAGGTLNGAAVIQVKAGTALSLADYVPVKPGFTFTGYKSGETVYGSNDTVTVNADMTLTAEWVEAAPETVSVTFDPAGGTLAETRVTAEKGAAVKLASYLPEKEGYLFKGWSDGTTLYAKDAEITPDADLALVAVWERPETPAENFTFTESEDGRSYILSGLAENFAVADVVVPGTYNGKPVTAIESNVFSYRNVIRSLDFSRCTALVTIGNRNFTSCENLEEVILSGCSKLEKIGDSCFLAPNKLKTVKLDGLTGLKEIGSHFFSYTGLAVTNTEVEELDFSDCTSLETIGQMSFWYLSKLKVLDFSHTKLTAVGRQFIKECPALEAVALPATLSLDKIGSEFITDTDNLKEIRVDALSLYLCVEGGVLYDIDKTVLIKAPAKGGLTEYAAPATLKKILSQAFMNTETLVTADLTACTLSEIGWQAFAGCTGATLKTAFNESGKNEDGTKATLGNNWNRGVLATEFAKVVEITVSGVKDGGKVASAELVLRAFARYGADDCDLAVTLNGLAVAGTDGTYVLALAVGENTITLTGSCDGKTSTVTIKVTRVEGNPTVSTNLKSRVICWHGATVDFVVDAKDAAGNPLGADAIDILYNWGYGNSSQTMGVTKTENPDGTVRVSVSYDQYYDDHWFFDDQEITLTVTVKDGEFSASAEYTVDWRENQPALTLETTLTDGAVYTPSNAVLRFTVTAKGADGGKLPLSALTLSGVFAYGPMDLSSAVTDNGDGTFAVSLNLAGYAQMGYFDFEDVYNLKLTLTIKDGSAVKTLEYTVKWVES